MVRIVMVGAICLSLLTSVSFAALNPNPSGTQAVLSKIRRDLKSRTKPSFEFLLKRWEADYGTGAVDPLLVVAQDVESPDTDRYIALMGAAKLGGPANAQRILPYLKDRSWMIRSGALKALSALRDQKSYTEILPLLQDKALVVRLQAVETVAQLNPPGSARALTDTLFRAENYHGGKAQWIPQKALAALRAMKAKEVAPRLMSLLNYNSDPSLQRQALLTLSELTGRPMPSAKPLAYQIQEFKTNLKSAQK